MWDQWDLVMPFDANKVVAFDERQPFHALDTVNETPGATLSSGSAVRAGLIALALCKGIELAHKTAACRARIDSIGPIR
jgi:hypothetical protein